MDEVYSAWYSESSYMEILGRFGREVGGAYCDSTVDLGEGPVSLPSLIVSRLEGKLNTGIDNRGHLSRIAKALLEYLAGSGLLDKFAEKRVVKGGLVLGYSLPYGFLEVCFTHHMKALGSDVTQEEAYEAIKELIKARIIVRCSSAGQDRYYALGHLGHKANQ
ncbi:MAG: hypothetical protein QW598_00260 [Pyrobaculum sp.]